MLSLTIDIEPPGIQLGVDEANIQLLRAIATAFYECHDAGIVELGTEECCQGSNLMSGEVVPGSAEDFRDVVKMIEEDP